MKPDIAAALMCITITAALFLGGCAATRGELPATGELTVLATTTIAADVVKEVGGDLVRVEALLPPGVDPHSFEPSPQDLVRATEARVIFASGAGLESFLEPLLRSAGGSEKVVYLSQGVTLIHAPQELAQAHQDEHEGEETGDPHTWFDPANVAIWAENAAEALSELDPEHAEQYRQNASAYRARLEELDAWIREQVEQIPAERRRLVTDHASFTYFANRYGFEQVGAVIPGYSTAAEPSAQEMARLEDRIRELQVRAVFVGEAISPNLVERVAQDTGVQLVRLYTASLSEPGGPASSYIQLMQYNVEQIVNALK